MTSSYICVFESVAKFASCSLCESVWHRIGSQAHNWRNWCNFHSISTPIDDIRESESVLNNAISNLPKWQIVAVIHSVNDERLRERTEMRTSQVRSLLLIY